MEDCCKNPKITLIREADGHRLCLSCKTHEYSGLTFCRKQWDAMMEDREKFMAATSRQSE